MGNRAETIKAKKDWQQTKFWLERELYEAQSQYDMRSRINGQIKAIQIRLVSEDGSDLGVFSITDALQLAASRREDVVEIEPGSIPPVCKLIDYGKYRYQLHQDELRKRGL